MQPGATVWRHHTLSQVVDTPLLGGGSGAGGRPVTGMRMEVGSPGFPEGAHPERQSPDFAQGEAALHRGFLIRLDMNRSGPGDPFIRRMLR